MLEFIKMIALKIIDFKFVESNARSWQYVHQYINLKWNLMHFLDLIIHFQGILFQKEYKTTQF
jgi:hypothetical protein